MSGPPDCPTSSPTTSMRPARSCASWRDWTERRLPPAPRPGGQAPPPPTEAGQDGLVQIVQARLVVPASRPVAEAADGQLGLGEQLQLIGGPGPVRHESSVVEVAAYAVAHPRRADLLEYRPDRDPA